MKYGRQLEQIEERFPPVWRGTMMKYAPLKDQLKTCCHGCNSNAFLEDLEQEVGRISRNFQTIAEGTLEAHRKLSSSWRRFCLPVSSSKIKLRNGMVVELTPEDVAQYSRLCIEYAKANAVALRKITKKHDKHCKSRKGQEKFAAFWSDQTGRCSFLHSPILVELAAIELSAQKAMEADAEVHMSSSPMSVHSDETGLHEHTRCPELGNVAPEELTCPICLDTPYQPIALACSHVFCKDCLFKAANRGRTIGSTQSILRSIPRTTQCPECRQTDVFAKAVILTETGKILKARYPDHWAARQEEDDALQKELRDCYERNRAKDMKGLRGFHPSYLIYS